jgi:hypothetical protein
MASKLREKLRFRTTNALGCPNLLAPVGGMFVGLFLVACAGVVWTEYQERPTFDPGGEVVARCRDAQTDHAYRVSYIHLPTAEFAVMVKRACPRPWSCRHTIEQSDPACPSHVAVVAACKHRWTGATKNTTTCVSEGQA